jgi:hypothetical protein
VRSRDGARCAQRDGMLLMRNRTGTKSVVRAALGGLLGITLLFAAGAAAFAQDAEDDDTIEQKVIKNIMKGMGADVDKDRIDFRERSPLVIPPTRDLPPPQEAGAITNPAWPKDPDKVKRVKQAKPLVNGSIAEQNMVSPERAPMISPEALRNGAIPRGSSERVTTPDSASASGNEQGTAKSYTPTELGFPGWGSFSSMFGYKAEQQPFTGEPPRTNLIQPPSGYQTPSPNYPYGMGQPKNNTVKDLPGIKDRAVGGDNL